MPRIICRNGFSFDMADLLLESLAAVVNRLHQTPDPGEVTGPGVFHH